MSFFIAIIVVLGFNELIQNQIRQYKRSKMYKVAQSRSTEQSKPLLVVGDPDNGRASRFFGSAYGCGDICVDITGCPKCANGQKIDLLSALKQMPDNSHIIYVSYVLEYVKREEIDPIIKELYRVSGDSANLYINAVQWYTLTAYLYGDGPDRSQRVLLETPPRGESIRYLSLEGWNTIHAKISHLFS